MSFKRLHTIATIAALGSMAGCGGDNSGPPPENEIVIDFFFFEVVTDEVTMRGDFLWHIEDRAGAKLFCELDKTGEGNFLNLGECDGIASASYGPGGYAPRLRVRDERGNSATADTFVFYFSDFIEVFIEEDDLAPGTVSNETLSFPFEVFVADMFEVVSVVVSVSSLETDAQRVSSVEKSWGVYHTYEATLDLSSLAEGEHLLKVIAVDDSGHDFIFRRRIVFKRS